MRAATKRSKKPDELNRRRRAGLHALADAAADYIEQRRRFLFSARDLAITLTITDAGRDFEHVTVRLDEDGCVDIEARHAARQRRRPH